MSKTVPFSQTTFPSFELVPTAQLIVPRRFVFTNLAKLADGRFLAVGCVGTPTAPCPCEIINAAGTGTVATGSTTFDRGEGSSVTVLGNGDVLAAGADQPLGGTQNKTETWNSGSGVWTTRGDCSPRTRGFMVTLPNGNALYCGGIDSLTFGSTILNTAQIYNQTTHVWASTGNMSNARVDAGEPIAIPSLGAGGKVFIFGGVDNFGGTHFDIDIYDVAAGTWSLGANMSVARAGGGNVLLKNGHVLVCGGSDAGPYSKVAEIYDPVGNTFTPTGDMNVARAEHQIILLPTGRVLVTGGRTWNDIQDLPTEIWDPGTGKWSLFANSSHDAYGAFFYPGALGLLNSASGDTGVIVVGGWSNISFQTSTTISTLKIVEPVSGITDTLIPDGSSFPGVSIVGPREGPLQTFRRISSSDGSLAIAAGITGQEPHSVDLKVQFPVPPTPPDWSDAALTEKEFSFIEIGVFPPQDHRWVNPDAVTLPSENGGWHWDPAFGAVPDTLNEGSGLTSTTAFRFRNASWSRLRFSMFKDSTSQVQVYIYNRQPWADNDESDDSFTSNPIVFDLSGLSFSNGIYVTPPVPPGYAWVSMRFISNATSGEDIRWFALEIQPVESSDWNTVFDDFLGVSGIGATQPALWKTLSSGGGGGSTFTPSTSTTFGASVIAVPPGGYGAIISGVGMELPNSQGIAFETYVTPDSNSNIVISVGVCGSTEDPAGQTNFTRIFYDDSVGPYWNADWTGNPHGVLPSFIPVLANTPALLRIEIAQNFTRFYVNGLQFYATTISESTPGGTPFVQISNSSGGTQGIFVDYIAMSWLRRFPGGF